MLPQSEANHELERRDLFARASHELRTPLTSILGYLEDALDEPGGVSGASIEYVQTAYRNAQRLQAIVDDLLTLDQIDSNMVEMDLGPVQFDALVAPLVRDFGTRCAGKRIRVDVESPPPSVELMIDAARTRQILTNVLTNALQHTPEGGALRITCELRGGHLEISVTDTGIGIPADELAKVFERFYRSRASTWASIPGSGLGLSIARSLAEAQGGALVATSVEGAGTTFALSVPIAAVAAGVG